MRMRVRACEGTGSVEVGPVGHDRPVPPCSLHAAIGDVIHAGGRVRDVIHTPRDVFGT